MPELTVNNAPVSYQMDGSTPLLFALRDASNLTGTKYGCGNGDCGACIVAVDGEAIRACLVTLDEVEGRFVTTIEGLSRDRSHAVQQAFAEANVGQCGFCLPAMVMSAGILLGKNDNPSDAEMDEAIRVYCRCGIYPRLRDAIRKAGRIARREESGSALPPPGISPEDAANIVPAMAPIGTKSPDAVDISRN